MIDQFAPVDYSHPHLRDCELLLKALPTLRDDYFYDLSTHGRNGTLTNMDPATDWVPSQRGIVLDLDGVNDYVTTNNAFADLWDDANTELTVSAYARFDAVNINQIMLSKYNSQSTPVGLFYLAAISAKVRVFVSNAGYNDYEWWDTDANCLSAGQWHHIMASVDLATQTATIEVDGVERASTKTTAGTVPTTLRSSATAVGAGAIKVANGSLSSLMNGQLDDLRIYSRVLTAEERRDIYLDTLGMRYSWIPRVGAGLPVMSYYQSPTAFVPQIIWYN